MRVKVLVHLVDLKGRVALLERHLPPNNNDNENDEKNIKTAKEKSSSKKKLKVINVSAKEKARNLEYLAKMKEETDIEPIWNQEHE